MTIQDITHRLVAALSKHEVLSDEQRKEWFVKAKEMSEEQVETLISILEARSHEEFEEQRKQINERQRELKKHTEELVRQGVKQAYKKAEEHISESEDGESERLLQMAENT